MLDTLNSVRLLIQHGIVPPEQCCVLIDRKEGVDGLEEVRNDLNLPTSTQLALICSADIYDRLFRLVRGLIRKDVPPEEIQQRLDQLFPPHLSHCISKGSYGGITIVGRLDRSVLVWIAALQPHQTQQSTSKNQDAGSRHGTPPPEKRSPLKFVQVYILGAHEILAIVFLADICAEGRAVQSIGKAHEHRPGDHGEHENDCDQE